MGRKQKIQYGAKAEIHAEASAESDSGPHGEGRPKTAPHHVAPQVFSAFAFACIFCVCPILYFLLWPNTVLYFWAGWGQQSMFFQIPCILIWPIPLSCICKSCCFPYQSHELLLRKVTSVRVLWPTVPLALSEIH